MATSFSLPEPSSFRQQQERQAIVSNSFLLISFRCLTFLGICTVELQSSKHSCTDKHYFLYCILNSTQHPHNTLKPSHVMKRARGNAGGDQKAHPLGIQLDCDGCKDGVEIDPLRIHPTFTGQLTPPPSPEQDLRPSKFRRHGSKILSVLRSMANSGKLLRKLLKLVQD